VTAALNARQAAINEMMAARVEPDLTNPVVVHANMLRGTIAKPTWEQIKHLYPEQFQSSAGNVDAITTLMIRDMFADHELPVDEAVFHKYEDLTRKILIHLRVEPQPAQDYEHGKSYVYDAMSQTFDRPAPAESLLWCCHARGPDDVYAAPDYITALAWSDALNEINWRKSSKLELKDPASWDECLIKAAPALWPHGPEAHAENLPKSLEGFSSPLSRPELGSGK
jgi:hypothetical protein